MSGGPASVSQVHLESAVCTHATYPALARSATLLALQIHGEAHCWPRLDSLVLRHPVEVSPRSSRLCYLMHHWTYKTEIAAPEEHFDQDPL
jgi:hypothetical protein